jgi:cytochrome c oxidase accessory protein FixG
MREQVCKYMCPYARFQSAMFDRDTLVITYDTERGEPRGARGKGRERAQMGDCVDCRVCVQVCPTGIDIRDGLQYECIGCAACIDGCDQVMDRMGYARGLIRYASENALARGYDRRAMWRRVWRPRTLVYTGLLALIVVATGVSLALRNPLKVDVLRDRGALAREVPGGLVQNVYRLQIMNTDEKPRAFRIEASGVDGLGVTGIAQPVEVGAAATRLVPMILQAPAGAAGDVDAEREREARAKGHLSRSIEIVVQAVGEPRVARREQSKFFFPR